MANMTKEQIQALGAAELMNVTEIRKGDVVRFKNYALRIETEPKINGAFVELRGRQSIDGCPLVTKKLNIGMAVNVERTLTRPASEGNNAKVPRRQS